MSREPANIAFFSIFALCYFAALCSFYLRYDLKGDKFSRKRIDKPHNLSSPII